MPSFACPIIGCKKNNGDDCKLMNVRLSIYNADWEIALSCEHQELGDEDEFEEPEFCDDNK